MQLKALIVDDDINYALETEMILDDLGIEICGKSSSWQEVYPKVKKLKPDFIVLDIFLSEKENGLDFAEKLKSLHIPFIICTGYPYEEYADKAFKYGAYGFFSKPLDKAGFSYKIRQLASELTEKSNEKYLSVKEKGILVKVPIKKVVWIEIDGNYSSIVLASGKKYIQKLSLKKYLEKLGNGFMQVRRSYIVNTYHIESMDVNSNELVLRNGEKVPVGIKFRNKVLELFD